MKRLFLIAFSVSLSFIASSFAQVPTPLRTDAMDLPSKHAWDIFVAISWPALDPVKTGKRGVPDTTKPFGAPGNATVWETWREATPEVFLPTGAKPPADYNDMSLVTSCPSGKVPEPAASHQVASFIEEQAPGRIKPMFNPVEGIAPVGTFGFGETRVNKATYDFILMNELWNVPTQVKYAKAFIGRTKPALSFPPDSIAAKAAWIEMNDDQIKSGKDKTFYLVNFNGKEYGLASLHITTKDTPNWFWINFHHKDIPGSGYENGDPNAKPAIVKGTIWDNYVLGGTQTDFITTTGDPTLLSDSYIEADFRRSSCISCHVKASRYDKDGKNAGTGDIPDIGSPNPSFYEDIAGNLKVLQFDFLYSLQVRAQKDNTNAKFDDPCKVSSNVK
jgi:hypothetical protein